MRLSCALRLETARHRRSLLPTQVARAWLFVFLLLAADFHWGSTQALSRFVNRAQRCSLLMKGYKPSLLMSDHQS